MSKPNASSKSAVHGFLNLYKPSGITSMDALRRIKRLIGQRQKVGHAGTMDPLARGVLPICFGQATSLMDRLVDGDKRYRMEVALGASTTTYDSEGEVVETKPVEGVTGQAVEEAIRPFLGVIEQTPPMYSAVKVKGQRLYKLARAGIEVERQARTVEVQDIKVVDFSPPSLVLEVECGRGVYMRSLAHDLGQSLGCGGFVSDLERLYCGGFHADDGVTLEQLEEAAQDDPDGWRRYLYTVDWVLKDLKSISVNPRAAQLLRNGQAVTLGAPPPRMGYMETVRAYSEDGRFLALVRFDRGANSWRPIKVFQVDSPSPYAGVSSNI